MATRLTLTLFRDCTADQLHAAIDNAIAQCDGSVAWNATDDDLGTYMAIHHNDTIHTVLIERHGTYGLLRNVGEPLDIPWMELRIQEGSHWDYSLMKGTEDVCDYSTFPEYFDNDPARLEMFKGDAQLFAQTWRVPLESIDRYHLQWGPMESESLASRIAKKIRGLFVTVERTDLETLLTGEHAQYSRTGKAYSTDEFEYGDIWQVLDLLHAIGGEDPSENGNEHRIDFGKY